MSSSLNNRKTTYSALLGTTIANKRQLKGFEQTDVANKLGITQASYSRLESGKSVINIDQLFLIAEILDTSATELVVTTEKYVNSLKESGAEVTSQSSINKKTSNENLENKPNSSNGGAVIAGAALGALLMAILANK